jgi:hypothetical protein
MPTGTVKGYFSNSQLSAAAEAATAWACSAQAHKSLDQPHHSPLLHSIKSVYDLVLIEHG